ncbi:MAG: ABC transporter ATP-binding protein [Clostridiales bacterium]|nr:ABC transporter ATP-binding protein [Clostridiales bacterium]
MAEIVLSNVTKRWGHFYGVDNISMTIENNSFVTLLGPSGCGKTTILRMIAGLETPTQGRITIDGEPVFDSEIGINVPPNKRKVGFLFQNYALWPNMTVYDNISFGLANIKEEMDEIDVEASILAKMITVFAKPADLMKVLHEAYNKKGEFSKKKAQLLLIDAYDISIHTAKRILSFSVHEGNDPEGKAKEVQTELEKKLDEIKAEYQKQREELTDTWQIKKDGKIKRRERKLTKEEIDLTVRRVGRIVKIGMFMDRYPSELSGGQQQRVAIARTLAPNPKVLFMDEPLSNLDAKLRLEMRSELQRLHHETGNTFVYVTHDQMEAMTLATKICLLDNGVLQQYDPPLTVYNKSINTFVADFVGNPAINFIEGKGEQEGEGINLSIFGGQEEIRFFPNAELDMNQWEKEELIGLEKEEQAQQERSKNKQYVEKSNKDTLFKYHISKINEGVFEEIEEEVIDPNFIIGIRPEYIEVSKDGAFEGEIFSAMPTGMETTIKISVGNILLTGVVFGGVLYSIGEKIRFNLSGKNAMLFYKESGKLIGLGSIQKIG